jgi:hypothetical protein
METVQAKARRGRKGPNDIIFVLPNGKIAFPRGFTPREGEWYDVEVIEDRGKYAFVRLHSHTIGESGICVTCLRVVDAARLKSFADQWLFNMLNHKRIEEIKETKRWVLDKINTLIGDIDEMIERLKKEVQPHLVDVNFCPPGYPTTDGCFGEVCRDEQCVKLENTIVALERIRNELSQKHYAIRRALDYDIIITTTPFGIERIFVPGI